MTEHWRPIRGWEGFYEVSSYGQVRSLARLIERSTGAVQVLKPRILAPKESRAGNGYKPVNLARDAKVTTYLVHRLVLEAFVGPAPVDMECRHLNGIRGDCRLANLEWGTHLENCADIFRHGRRPGHPPLTHCKRGHAFTEENTHVAKSGTRSCRTCARDLMRVYRAGGTAADLV